MEDGCVRDIGEGETEPAKECELDEVFGKDGNVWGTLDKLVINPFGQYTEDWLKNKIKKIAKTYEN